MRLWKCMLVKWTIIMTGPTHATDANKWRNKQGKKVIFKNCAPLFDYINETINRAEDLDIVKLIYNLIVYGNDYSKASGNLWQPFKDELGEADNATIAGFISFKSKMWLENPW